MQNDFIANAPSFLPLLHEKPHLMVLNHAASSYLQQRSTLLTHPHAQRFTITTLNPQPLRGEDLRHVISSPYFFHAHYGRGSPALRRDTAFNPEAVNKTKTRFAIESFLVRMPDRIAVHK